MSAATGDDRPYDGWVEAVVNLQENEDSDLSISVPFLVSGLELDRPLIGFNVIQVLIKNNESRPKLMSILSLLAGAMEIDDAGEETIANFVQTPKVTKEEHAAVKVGFEDVTISAGHLAHINCRVPANINPPEPLVVFEPTPNSAQVDRLSIGARLMEIHKTDRHFIKVPVSNRSMT